MKNACFMFSPIRLIRPRPAKAEGRPFPRHGFDPDSAPAVFDDFFAHGQPDARAGIVGLAVKMLENLENALLLVRWDADARWRGRRSSIRRSGGER